MEKMKSSKLFRRLHNNIGQAKSEQTQSFHLCLTDCLHMRDNQKAISVGFHLTTIRMLRVTLTALIHSELCVTCNLFHPFEIHPTWRGGREGHIRGLHHPDLGHSLEERTFADDGGMGIARTHHAEFVGREGEIALGRTIP